MDNLIKELDAAVTRVGCKFTRKVANLNDDTKNVVVTLSLVASRGGAIIVTDSYTIPGRMYNGTLDDNDYELIVDAATGNCGLTVSMGAGDIFKMNIPAGSHGVGASVAKTALNNAFDISGADMPVMVNRLLDAPVVNKTAVPNTFNAWAIAVRDAVESDAANYIAAPSTGMALNIDVGPRQIADRIVGDLIANTNRNGISNYIPMSASRDLFGAYGTVDNIVKDISKISVIVAKYMDFKSYNKAKDFVIANLASFQTGAGNNATGGDAVDFFVKISLSKGIASRQISSVTRNISTAATATATSHPLKNYFKPTTGFAPSFPGQAANYANKNGDLNYIDSNKIGVSRIQTVQSIMTNDEQAIVRSTRFNSVLARMIIFMINSYRIVLYRLRQDAKNRTGTIARKPEEILDDNDTEFYGFDMYE